MKYNQPIQISVPNPCHEDWSKMTPKEQGRFCSSCQKSVVDFTGFSDEQLYKFLAEREGQKICGRFSSSQLNRQISMPHQPHSTLYKWMIAAGLVLVFTSISSPLAFAQIPMIQPKISVVENLSIDTTNIEAEGNVQSTDSNRSFKNDSLALSADTVQPVMYIIDGMVAPKITLDSMIVPHQNGLPAKYSNHYEER